MQVVGFIWGYVCEQFVQTIYILGAGFVLSCIVSIQLLCFSLVRKLEYYFRLSFQSCNIEPPLCGSFCDLYVNGLFIYNIRRKARQILTVHICIKFKGRLHETTGNRFIQEAQFLDAGGKTGGLGGNLRKQAWIGNQMHISAGTVN